MYSINLIHEKVVPIRKQRKRMSLVSLYILIWIISGVVVSSLYVSNKTKIDSYRDSLRRVESKNTLPSGLTNDDVTSLDRQLQASSAALTTLRAQQLLWGVKLRLMQTHVPDGLWFNRMVSRRAQSGAPGGAPPPAGKILGEFVIEGMIAVPETESGAPTSAGLDAFVNALKQDQTFMKGLSGVTSQLVGRKRLGTQEIVSFMIVCSIAEGVRFDG